MMFSPVRRGWNKASKRTASLLRGGGLPASQPGSQRSCKYRRLLRKLSLLLFFLFPVCTSLCLCLYIPCCFFAFCYLLSFLFFAILLLFLLFAICSLFAFCYLLCFVFFFGVLSAGLFFGSLVSLVAECVCLFFCSDLCSTPLAKRASLKSATNCAFSCVFPFLTYCFLLLPCLTWTFLSLSSLLDMWFFRFWISIFRRRVVIFHHVHQVFFFRVACGLIGFRGDLYSVPHVSETYARGPPF